MLDAAGRAKWGHRAPSDDLLEHRGEIRELVPIRETWQSVVADDRVDLGLTFVLYLRVSSHCEEEGGHDRNGLQGRGETSA